MEQWICGPAAGFEHRWQHVKADGTEIDARTYWPHTMFCDQPDGWEGVLTPVVERYQGKVSRIYLRADAVFANPEVYDYLEAERIKYAIRLPANRVLQERIGHLLQRPTGRPPNEVRRYYANFTYQARS